MLALSARPRSSHSARLRLRLVLAGAALSAAITTGAVHLAAAPIGHHDSNAPVDFSADHMELEDKQKRVVLTGNVDVVQADLHLIAERTLMAYTDANKLTLQRIDATGRVVVTQRDQRAAGDVAVYDLIRKVITMVGHVSLRRGNGDTLNGGRLTIDLDTGISSIDGHMASPSQGAQPGNSGGRVSGTFNVPKRDNKPAQ